MTLSSTFTALWVAAAPAPTGDDVPLDLPAQAPQLQEAATGGGGGIVRTIVGLAVVIGVIFGLHWVLKQVKASREGGSDGSGMESLATVALGPNRSMHLVRVGREVIVVGAAEHGVTPIRVYGEEEAAQLLDAPEELDALPAATPLAELTAAERPKELGRVGTDQLVKALQRWTVRG